MTGSRFEARVVLVTGGGSGIGRAAAVGFAREGAAVAIGDINAADGDRVAAEIVSAGGRALAVAMDASREADVAALVARTVATYGKLDHAFNNVGLSHGGTLETTTEAEWDSTMALTLKSTWLAMKHELPVMRAAGFGSIVNTSSAAGKRPNLYGPAYAAAKAGVVHLTACTALAYAEHGIRVNSVSPGLTATPLIERILTAEARRHILAGTQMIERMVQPAEVADAVMFLCSDAAAMVNGTDLEVCGGLR